MILDRTYYAEDSYLQKPQDSPPTEAVKFALETYKKLSLKDRVSFNRELRKNNNFYL